jgi:hypothetical protein
MSSSDKVGPAFRVARVPCHRRLGEVGLRKGQETRSLKLSLATLLYYPYCMVPR